MCKLIVVVPVGRRASGRAVLIGNDGRLRVTPFRVLATASSSAAARRGNPGRDWRRPFGHMPTGSYVVAGAIPPGAPTVDAHGVGREPLGALVLSPVGGNALEALRAGRTRFLLHGGPPDAMGRLRSTFGGLRVSDADLTSLLRAINVANAERDPLSSVEVDETSTPAWTEEADDEVPSSRGGTKKAPRKAAPQPKVPRAVLTSYGFGAGTRRASAPSATPGRRAFLGLALFTFGALGFACGGTDGAGGVRDDWEGGPDGGHDGGGADAGYEGGYGTFDGGRDGGVEEGGHDGGEAGKDDGGLTTGTTETASGIGTGTDTTTTGTDTTTTGTDPGTTGAPGTTAPVTTGTDTTTTGTVTTGTDTTTTGTDTGTTGTDTGTTGTDTGTTGTDTGTTGTDTGTTGTDTGTTGTDGTTFTTGTDTGTTGTDFGTDSFARKRRHKRRKPSNDEGTGT